MPSLTLSELAERTGTRLEGVPGDSADRMITGPAALSEATEEQVSFLVETRYTSLLETTRAGLVVLGEDVEVPRADLPVLRCPDPQATFSRIVEVFAPVRPSPVIGVHPSAILSAGTEVDASASIGPLCVIGEGARIAAGAVLHPRVVVGAQSQVGAGTILHPGVVLYPHVQIGEHCIVHGGAIIGSDGFGFEPTPEGWVKTPQGGIVVIEDDVEIGANVTIDCARFGQTHIATNVKLDNLVHVAHNVTIGRSSLFLGQSAVAGSTHVGKGVIVAGQAGLSGHLNIGDGARIGAKAAVMEDVPAGEDWWGSPAGPKAQTLRDHKALRRVARMREELQTLRDRVRALEEERS